MSLIFELEFLSYKVICLNNQQILNNLIDKLRLFYIRVDSENLSEEDRIDNLIEASVISMFIDLHVTEAEYIKTNLRGDDLNIFLDKFLSLKETQAAIKLKS